MQVHSLYGQLLAEVGIIGMIAFAGVIAGVVLNARDSSRCCSGTPWRERGFCFWVSASVLASALLMLILGMAGHNLYRYTWIWYGAFQVTALHCSRRQLFQAHFDLV